MTWTVHEPCRHLKHLGRLHCPLVIFTDQLLRPVLKWLFSLYHLRSSFFVDFMTYSLNRKSIFRSARNVIQNAFGRMSLFLLCKQQRKTSNWVNIIVGSFTCSCSNLRPALLPPGRSPTCTLPSTYNFKSHRSLVSVKLQSCCSPVSQSDSGGFWGSALLTDSKIQL